MTLVLGFRWSNGNEDAILMVSDTRAVTPYGIMFEAKKIHVITSSDGNKYLGVIGGAGDSALVKWAFEVADEVLKKHAGDDGLIFFNDVRNAVREIEERLMGRLSRLRREGLEPKLQLILGSVDLNGKASLYMFNESGLAEPVHDDPGYAIIGSGLITGGILLLRLFGLHQEMDLGLFTAFILDTVSEVDYSVGPFVGESYLMRVVKNGDNKYVALGPLKDEFLREYKEKIRTRRVLLQRIWRLCDTVGEKYILTLLEELEKDQAGVSTMEGR
jgi:hypothetical protein